MNQRLDESVLLHSFFSPEIPIILLEHLICKSRVTPLSVDWNVSKINSINSLHWAWSSDIRKSERKIKILKHSPLKYCVHSFINPVLSWLKCSNSLTMMDETAFYINWIKREPSSSASVVVSWDKLLQCLKNNLKDNLPVYQGFPSSVH